MIFFIIVLVIVNVAGFYAFYFIGYHDATKRAIDMLDSEFKNRFKNAGVVVKKDDRIIECNGMMIPMQCKECRFGRVKEDSVECFVPDYDGVPVLGVTKI